MLGEGLGARADEVDAASINDFDVNIDVVPIIDAIFINRAFVRARGQLRV